MRAIRDAGESLVETVLSVVLISLTVTALVSSLSTAGNAGTAQRNSVKTDIVMRDYAEAIKSATQGCVANRPYAVGFVPPSGFTVAMDKVATCPTVDAPQLLTLSVEAPTGATVTMQIRVRTP
jgi:hypothetical protein